MKPMIDYKKLSTPVPGELDDILANCRKYRELREAGLLPQPRKMTELEMEIMDYGGSYLAGKDGLTS